MNLKLNYKQKKRSVDWVTVLLVIIIALLLCRVIFTATYTKVYVVGDSMRDTLAGGYEDEQHKKVYPGGDYVYTFKTKVISRGNIVTLRATDPNTGAVKTIIKRVIAFGGESVEIQGGKVYIDGEMLDEPYLNPERNSPTQDNFVLDTVDGKVPQGHIFCLGDNRVNSWDSRYYGCFDRSVVTGVVADWSLHIKGIKTPINSFFDFTLPNAFGSN
ncbi:MAG: signal peptidase I [Clostridia bacterium]|nr:signal peptidase I [Clostridia bacterium]